MMMRKYPVPTKEEAEELRRLRQEAGMTIPQMAEAFHTQQSRISDYENGKRGTDPDLIEKLKKEIFNLDQEILKPYFQQKKIIFGFVTGIKFWVIMFLIF